MVLVTPNWKNKPWQPVLDEICIRREIISAGRSVYERQTSQNLLPGRHWETLVTYVDTTQKNVEKSKLNAHLIEEISQESKNWGPTELKREMKKYPQNVSSSGEEKRTQIVVDEIRTDRKILQLMMPLYVELPSGKGKVLNVIIDTGAAANLVKKGI